MFEKVKLRPLCEQCLQPVKRSRLKCRRCRKMLCMTCFLKHAAVGATECPKYVEPFR